MGTGENEQGLRKIIDLTRMISVLVLLLHFYYYCYDGFYEWNLVSPLTDRLLFHVVQTGFFSSLERSKLVSLVFLLLSLLGAQGKKSVRINYHTSFLFVLLGAAFYFGSVCSFYFSASPSAITLSYTLMTSAGYLLILMGGTMLARILKKQMPAEVFNTFYESFPQEEKLISNPQSLNLPARYRFRGKLRHSWINFINPMRGILVMGSPGSGKTYFLVENFIRQLTGKHRALFVYDYKFPELTTLTYNLYLKHQKGYPPATAFYTLNFDQLSRSHRCNPLHPSTLPNLTSAMDAAKSLLLSMNRSWVHRQGEFFVESPINILAAGIWFLRKFKNGSFCTLPHVIELLHTEYEKLFTVLRTEPEIAILINPFVESYLSDDMETLGSQMSSVKIPLGRISSPELYYLLSVDDFTLDINDNAYPKIFCLGNSIPNQDALAPVLSLFIDRLNKIINRKGGYPCAQVCDEFATVRAANVMRTIATGRSNDIISIITLQDYSQLKLTYSREEAEVIFNITGNLVSGQVSGETAKLLSERFAKIFQPRESISINSSDTSVSRSAHLEPSVPASTISHLSSGEFVGMVADNPDEPIEWKAFHAKIIQDLHALRKEQTNMQPLPSIRNVSEEDIRLSFEKIKQEVQDIVAAVLETVLNDPEKKHLIVRK